MKLTKGEMSLLFSACLVDAGNLRTQADEPENSREQAAELREDANTLERLARDYFDPECDPVEIS